MIRKKTNLIFIVERSHEVIVYIDRPLNRSPHNCDPAAENKIQSILSKLKISQYQLMRLKAN